MLSCLYDGDIEPWLVLVFVMDHERIGSRVAYKTLLGMEENARNLGYTSWLRRLGNSIWPLADGFGFSALAYSLKRHYTE